MRIHGFDLSLNHAAVVELTDGEMTGFWYFTDVAGSAARSAEHGFRLELPKSDERQQRQMARLAWIENWIDKEILVPRRPDYVGMEDYAVRAEQGAHYLGESGGIARILFWFRGVSFRLHDPISVKMFATHDGTAQKDSIERAVKERWGVDFGPYNQPPPKKGKQSRRTSEDLADAFAIAKLVEVEVGLRAGIVDMRSLHPKEIQVFNRVTKTYPVSLLGREWLRNPGGKFTPHGRFEGCSSERCVLSTIDSKGLLAPPLRAKLVKMGKKDG